MRKNIDDRPKVVVIDDEADFLTAMERSLKSLYRVTALYGSEWTYEQVAALEPDLVLLDIHMPGQDGIDLCRQLRADARFTDTPIIFLTASSSQEDLRRHIEVRGTRCLNKVIDRRQLLEIMGEELAAVRARRATTSA